MSSLAFQKHAVAPLPADARPQEKQPEPRFDSKRQEKHAMTFFAKYSKALSRLAK